MNLLDLRTAIKDKKGTTPFVRQNEKRSIPGYYEKNISDYCYLTSTQPIYLELRSFDDEPWYLRDYMSWGIGSPNAYHIVCSVQFRKVLERLALPEHRFYDAEISIKNRSKHSYYVLHFLQDWTKELDYSQSVFQIVDLMERKKVVKVLAAGEISSVDKYNEINELLVSAYQYLYPLRMVFRKGIYYDVWGLHGHIVMSERAKQLIEQEQITGVAFPDIRETKPFENLDVIMEKNA